MPVTGHTQISLYQHYQCWHLTCGAHQGIDRRSNDGPSERPCNRIRQDIPDDLAYAAQHWAYHLCVVDSSDEVLFELDKFFQNSFLHWLEVLSLLGHVDGASEAMAAAEKFAQGKNPHLATFLQNGIKLIGIHAPAIAESMMFSALATDPRRSGIMAKYMMQFQFDVPLVQKGSILLKAPVAEI
ncbi:hypothetical protein R3P38DRAFT_3522310 [Favolaschia claudopus]|uniref:Uncharacterized protein n=1 Tax=Favolaschia claudopus TaxID=2862362 RepID=A0AAW0E466_9AGAR